MSNTNGHERVSWIEPCVPDSEEARIVYELITSCGVRTRRALARALADELFARDARRVGAVSDIGIFRAWYDKGAERLLERLDGRAIAIEREP
jgi:hypothetical protein